MPISKKTLGIIAGIIVVGGGIAFFLMRPAEEPVVSEIGGSSNGTEALFITLSSQLDPVAFDTSVFSDPRFAALVDIHTNIIPEASGRRDPFAPIPGMASSAR
ncbi:MAG: hypothetical protein JWN64_821 [Parcubacteria group bacterium]|nr:hypothetical protein [Parcubacteria group bacterium]